MSFTFTAKQVGALITKVDGRTLRSAIQTAVVHVIGHAMAYGHSPLANALDERMALTPMMKRHQKAVRRYLTTYGPFVVKEEVGLVFDKVKRDKLIDGGYAFEVFAEEAAMWDDEPRSEDGAKGPAPFDLFTQLVKLADTAEKKSLKGQCLEAGLIDQIKALCGHWAGQKAIAKAAADAKVGQGSPAAVPALPAGIEAAAKAQVAVDAAMAEPALV
jgi:hypothetical protein